MSPKPRPRLCLFVFAIVLGLAAACTRETPLPPYDREAAWKTLGLEGTEPDYDAKLPDLAKVVLDPPPVVGENYHPTFPPDLPFNPAEWQTNTPSPSIANPHAPKGGMLRLSMGESFPPTLRTEGPNSRLSTLSDIQDLIYETLLSYDIALGDYVPSLANYWQIGEDKKTFRFRINPKARWSNGQPVTADDVKATFEHNMNQDRKDPANAQQYQELIEEVKVLDRLTVEVRAKEARWRSLLTISWGTKIYPAAYIRMDGETYLTEWNWKLPPGTGAYELRPEDIQKGRAITVRRRRDYWDADNPYGAGTSNFDEIRWEVIRDEELEYQKFLAGELDIYQVTRAQRWVDELDREKAIAMGWVQRRKIYNQSPNGYGGYCFNMREAPFNSLQVRKAFAHLLNREKVFEKFTFYQYEYIDSYFPGQIWSRPNAERVRYDPAEALRLLAADGWTQRDAEGYLVNDREERFPTLTLEFASPGFLRFFTLYKDDLWQQAGIKLELKQMDGSTLLKNVWDSKFKLVFWNWTASLFPDFEFQFHSKFADEPQTNNLNGYKNAEADAIMDAYKYEFDANKRREMLHRLDAILFEEHPYALAWYAPYFRVLYWDKLGHPPEYAGRFPRDINNITAYWWYDADKDRRLQAAKTQGQPLYEDRPGHQYDAVDQVWWKTHENPMSVENH